MKKVFVTILFVSFSIYAISQTLLESNNIIHGKNWKKENDIYFKPLSTGAFKLTAWADENNNFNFPIRGNVGTRSGLDSMAIGYPIFKHEIITNLFSRKKNTIESIQSDTMSVKKLIANTENGLTQIDDNISFVKKNTDTSIAKETLLSKEFTNNIKLEQANIKTNLELIKNIYILETIIDLRAIEQLLIDTSNNTTLSYAGCKRIDSIIDSRLTNIKKIANKINAAQTEIKNSIELINNKMEEYKKIITPDDKDKTQTMSVLPALNAKLGKRELLPNITVVGSAKLGENGRSYGDIRLFTGAGGNPKNLVTLENLLFQEFSSFGFISNFSYSFFPENNKTHRFALSFGINYLGKNLQKSDTADFNTSVFHFKAGGELAIDPEKLSIYLNFNRLTVADNVEKFEKEFGMSNKLFGFTDFGAKMKLNMLNNQSTSLDIDLGFIVNTNDVKDITKTNDLILPRIKIGITQKLLK